MGQPTESMCDRLRRISGQYVDERKQAKRREEEIEEMIRKSAKRWAEKQIAKLPARLEAAVKSGEDEVVVRPPFFASGRVKEAGLNFVAEWANEQGLCARVCRLGNWNIDTDWKVGCLIIRGWK